MLSAIVLYYAVMIKACIKRMQPENKLNIYQISVKEWVQGEMNHFTM